MKASKFIEKACIKHNNKYDYSLVVDTISIKEKYRIICDIHGIFEQRGDAHLAGQGCGKCGNSVLTDINEFILKANNVHNDKYDYSLVVYINSKTPVDIICPIHGLLQQTPDNHLSGHGCPKCGFEISADYKKNIAKNTFVKKSNLVHNSKYDYSLTKYIGAHDKIKIICSNHGIFEQTPNDHLNGKGCPKCCQSKGEIKIIKYLDERNIKYNYQHSFHNCKHINNLVFDFYLPEYNVCIEFDGIQHFEPINYFGGEKELELVQKRDRIKTAYCQENNIGLVRVRFDENINNKLNNYINIH
jgi:very-short-patch-repair endonuclease